MRKAFLIARFIISACVILFVIALIIGFAGLNDAFSGASYKPIEEEYEIDSVNGGKDKVVIETEANKTIDEEEQEMNSVTENVIDAEEKTTTKQEIISSPQVKENNQHISDVPKENKNDTSTENNKIIEENNSKNETIKEEENISPQLPKEEEAIEDIIEENKEEEVIKQEDNSVNTSHLDYPTHKGRIDCTDYNKCMDDSLKIYFSYKKIISNVFYVEVKSNSNKSLGYFTEYVFKEHTYSSEEECQRVGSEIKALLSDRITGYNCDSSNTLKIITDY